MRKSEGTDTTQKTPSQFQFALGIAAGILILLKTIAASNGPVNGQGPDTVKAVKAFQAQRQLKVDGKIGIKTFLKIVADFKSTCLINQPTASPVKVAAFGRITKPPRLRPGRTPR